MLLQSPFGQYCSDRVAVIVCISAHSPSVFLKRQWLRSAAATPCSCIQFAIFVLCVSGELCRAICTALSTNVCDYFSYWVDLKDFPLCVFVCVCACVCVCVCVCVTTDVGNQPNLVEVRNLAHDSLWLSLVLLHSLVSAAACVPHRHNASAAFWGRQSRPSEALLHSAKLGKQGKNLRESQQWAVGNKERGPVFDSSRLWHITLRMLGKVGAYSVTL